MASAPLSMPSWLEFQEFRMKLINTRDSSMLENRRTETADFGSPYWVIEEARTDYLTEEQIDDLEAFFEQASRGGATFICPDAFRLRPRAYGNVPLAGFSAPDNVPFNGDAEVNTIHNSRQVTVEGLPANFEINRGCLIEFRNSALVRSLHRVTTSVKSIGAYVLPGYVLPGYVLPDGDGRAIVNFEPPLNTGIFTVGSTAHFEKPSCIMMLTSYDMPKAHGSRTATFTATEVFFS